MSDVQNLNDLTEDELQQLADTITDEEFEQLDELSKATLGSYMGKANDKILDAKRGVPAAAAKKAKRAAGMRAASSSWLKKEETEVLDETAASDSIKAKSVHMAQIMSQMAGMDHKDITKIADILNQVGHEADKLPDRANAGSNKHSVDAVADAKSATMFSVKEDLAEMFAGSEDLTEDFVNKIETLFEAALNMRVSVEREAIMEEAMALVEEQVESEVGDLEDQLDKYLQFVVDGWKADNEVALITNIRTNQMEAFMADLTALMEEHNIDLPEDKVDVVESLVAELDEAKAALDEQIERNIENQKIIDESNRSTAFDEIAEGLAATQIEKLRSLSEGLDFGNLDEYKKKIATLRDHHFKEVKTSNLSEEIDSSDNTPEPKRPAGSMGRYSTAITQSLKR